jgi:hypothetical protein
MASPERGRVLGCEGLTTQNARDDRRALHDGGADGDDEQAESDDDHDQKTRHVRQLTRARRHAVARRTIQESLTRGATCRQDCGSCSRFDLREPRHERRHEPLAKMEHSGHLLRETPSSAPAPGHRATATDCVNQCVWVYDNVNHTLTAAVDTLRFGTGRRNRSSERCFKVSASAAGGTAQRFLERCSRSRSGSCARARYVTSPPRRARYRTPASRAKKPPSPAGATRAVRFGTHAPDAASRSIRARRHCSRP